MTTTSDFNSNPYTMTTSSDFVNAINTFKTSQNQVFESPQCWIGSFQEIIRTNFHEQSNEAQGHSYNNLMANLPGSSVCASLTGDQRITLALELTKCFFTESYLNFPPQCNTGMGSKHEIRACIQSLNETEFKSYNEFYSQIYTICTQLSQETWNTKLVESTYLLFESSKQLTDNLDQIVLDHRSDWDHFNEQHRIEQEFYFNKMNEKLESSSSEIDRLSHIFQRVNKVISNGQEHVPILQPFLLFLVLLNITWIITSTTRSRRARPFIMSLIFFEFLLEIAFWHLFQNSFIPIAYSEVAIHFIRKSFLFCTTFAFFASVISVKKDKTSSPLSAHEVQEMYDKIIDKVDSSLMAHRKEMEMREDRLMRSFYHSISVKDHFPKSTVPYSLPPEFRLKPITPMHDYRGEHIFTQDETMDATNHGERPKRGKDIPPKSLEIMYPEKSLRASSCRQTEISPIMKLPIERTIEGLNDDRSINNNCKYQYSRSHHLTTDFIEDIEETPKVDFSDEDEISLLGSSGQNDRVRKRRVHELGRVSPIISPEKRQRMTMQSQI